MLTGGVKDQGLTFHERNGKSQRLGTYLPLANSMESVEGQLLTFRVVCRMANYVVQLQTSQQFDKPK